METSRLLLSGLIAADAAFMFELLNTPLWMKFIGDKEIVVNNEILLLYSTKPSAKTTQKKSYT